MFIKEWGRIGSPREAEASRVNKARFVSNFLHLSLPKSLPRDSRTSPRVHPQNDSSQGTYCFHAFVHVFDIRRTPCKCLLGTGGRASHSARAVPFHPRSGWDVGSCVRFTEEETEAQKVKVTHRGRCSQNSIWGV